MEEYDWDLLEQTENAGKEGQPTKTEIRKSPVKAVPVETQPIAVQTDVVLPESGFELRMLGFYNYPHQNMNPEMERVEEAAILAELLDTSFKDSLSEFDADSPLVKLYDKAVLIFRDRDKNLYTYFPKKRIARLTDVVYNKYKVLKTEGELRCWFHPGESFSEASFRYKHRRERRRTAVTSDEDDD